MREPLDRGSALVEVVFLLVVLALPSIYLVSTVARLQAGAYAASAAAREAGRAFVTAPHEEAASGRAYAAAQLVFDAHGFSGGEGAVGIGCTTDPCLTPGSQVQVSVSVDVPLPLIPGFLDGVVPSTVQLSSSHLEPVDRFRSG